MKIRIIIALLILLTMNVYAININEAINYAEENSAMIKIAYENVKIAGIEKKQAISNFLPTASFSASYTKLDSVPSMQFPSPLGGVMTVDLAVADNYSAGINMGQPIFMGGKLITAYQISSIQEVNARIEYEKSVADIKMAVIQMYLTGLLMDELYDMNIVLLNAGREHFENTQSRYSLGSASKLELLSAEMSYKQLEPKIKELINQKQNIISSLKLIMGMKSDEEIDLEGDIKSILDSLMVQNNLDLQKKGELTDRSIDENKDLKMARNAVSIVSKAYSIAKYNFLPNIVLFGNYQYANKVNQTNDSLVMFNDTFYFYDSFTWGLSVSFDIFNGGKRVLDVIKAGHQYKQMNMLYANQIKQTKIDIEKIINNYEIAALNAETFTYTLTLAEEAYNMAQTQYSQGIISNSDYTDAESNFVSAHLGYSQNLYNQLINYYSLLNALGIL